jgi:hypothetical protein
MGHNKVLFKICDQVGKTYFSTSRSMEIYENPTWTFPKNKDNHVFSFLSTF